MVEFIHGIRTTLRDGKLRQVGNVFELIAKLEDLNDCDELGIEKISVVNLFDPLISEDTPLVKISIRSKSNTPVTSDNWLKIFLNGSLYPTGLRKIIFEPIVQQYIDYDALSVIYHLGRHFLTFKYSQDPTRNFVISVYDPIHSPDVVEPIEHATVFYKDPSIEKCMLSYSHTRLALITRDLADVTTNVYMANFKQALPTETALKLHIEIDTAFRATPEMFEDTPVDSHPKSVYLIWRDFDMFHYVETSDGKVRFTTMEIPSLNAMAAVFYRISLITDEHERESTEQSFRDSLMTTLKERFTENDILNICVEYLNKV